MFPGHSSRVYGIVIESIKFEGQHIQYLSDK